mmetsp:Transcript_31125/g.48750  ORF Transcript_31125/g.48750 Transcript_31125/m.48750 type:complete len:178 (+) Transcript_31125:70-603(+)
MSGLGAKGLRGLGVRVLKEARHRLKVKGLGLSCKKQLATLSLIFSLKRVKGASKYLKAFADFKEAPQPGSSGTHKDICKGLRTLGFEFEEESPQAHGIYSVDVVIRHQGETIALEVDGPSHFRRSGVPDPHTLLKRELLGSLGLKVLSIEATTWDSLSAPQRLRHLKEKIDSTAHGV